jgi:hypothetical protein
MIMNLRAQIHKRELAEKARLVHEAGRLLAKALVIKNDPRRNKTSMNQPC